MLLKGSILTITVHTALHHGHVAQCYSHVSVPLQAVAVAANAPQSVTAATASAVEASLRAWEAPPGVLVLKVYVGVVTTNSGTCFGFLPRICSYGTGSGYAATALGKKGRDLI